MSKNYRHLQRGSFFLWTADLKRLCFAHRQFFKRRRLEALPHSSSGVGLFGMFTSGTHLAQVTQLARCVASEVKETPPVVQHIASLGASGLWDSNSERDLHRWTANLYNSQLERVYLTAYLLHILFYMHDSDSLSCLPMCPCFVKHPPLTTLPTAPALAGWGACPAAGRGLLLWGGGGGLEVG